MHLFVGIYGNHDLTCGMGENVLNAHAAPPVAVRIGTLPPLWPHGVVFFANIDRIFYGDEEKTRHLMHHVQGFSNYGARMIPVLGLLYRGGNLLVLSAEPVASTLDYFESSLGIRLPETLVLPMEARGAGIPDSPYGHDIAARVRQHPAQILDGYVTDPDLERFAESVGKKLTNLYASSRAANDKILLHRHLVREGLPLFDGGETRSEGELQRCLDSLKRKGYRKAIVRASLGASGFGMTVIDLSSARGPSLGDLLSREGGLLCQGWVEPGLQGIDQIVSPSIQFFCSAPDGITLFDITEQLLSRSSVHEGNVVPPEAFSPVAGDPVYDELIRQARSVCRWVASTGYRGTGSIDFLVYGHEEKKTIVVCEVNARVTGATYPSLLARNFQPHGSWMMRNYMFQPCSRPKDFFTSLDDQGLLFRANGISGILPINVIPDADGFLWKAQILFMAGRRSECVDLEARFPTVVPRGCVYDRD